MPELKPCPCCGNHLICRIVSTDLSQDLDNIICSFCGLIAKTVDNWNRRVTDNANNKLIRISEVMTSDARHEDRNLVLFQIEEILNEKE
jgi:hypothetical protein